MFASGVNISSASLLVGAFGVLVAAITVVWYVVQQRHSEKEDTNDDARTEALALAETRGKRIDDLEADISRLQKRLRDDRDEHDKQIKSLRQQVVALEDRLTQATSNFAAAQSLTAQGATDLAVSVTGLLEARPSKVDEALILLHAYLASRSSSTSD